MKLKAVPAAIAGDSGQLLVKVWANPPAAAPEDVHIPSAIRGAQWDLETEAFLGHLSDSKALNEREHFSATTKPPNQQKTSAQKLGNGSVTPITHPKFARVHPLLPIYALVDNTTPIVQVPSEVAE